MKFQYEVKTSSTSSTILSLGDISHIDAWSHDHNRGFTIQKTDGKGIICKFSKSTKLHKGALDALVEAREEYLAAQNTQKEAIKKPPALYYLRTHSETLPGATAETIDDIDLSIITHFSISTYAGKEDSSVSYESNGKEVNKELPKKEAQAFQKAWRDYKNA